MGYNSTIQATETELLTRIGFDQPAAIFLDLVLTDRSGWTVLTGLKARVGTHAPLIGNTSMLHEREWVTAPCVDACLVQPMSPLDVQRAPNECRAGAAARPTRQPAKEHDA